MERERHQAPPVRADLLAVVFGCSSILFVVLNVLRLGMFKNLSAHHPYLALYSWTFVALKLCQGAWIIAAPRSYARWRVTCTALTRAFVAQLLHPAILQAGAARPGYLKLQWLAPDGTEVRVSSRLERLQRRQERSWQALRAAALRAGDVEDPGEGAVAVHCRGTLLPQRLPVPAAPALGSTVPGEAPAYSGCRDVGARCRRWPSPDSVLVTPEAPPTALLCTSWPRSSGRW
jgi:hypothetical protein